MKKIQIACWLLTRKCNLKCSYCGISRNIDIPSEYPPLSHFFENEMTTENIRDYLEILNNHNSKMFHIFFGGEPFLRRDLRHIIQFCNEKKIAYTIITNGTFSERIDKLINSISYVSGLTTSVDPINPRDSFSDIKVKSQAGFELLKSFKIIPDRVAEMTLTSKNIGHALKTIKLLEKEGINTSITAIDLKHSKYYDFSNIVDKSLLLKKDEKTKSLLYEIMNNCDIHMADIIIPKLFENLPAKYDCELEKGVHNITIDADGTIRLCLRIRGVKTPKKSLKQYFDKDGEMSDELLQNISFDKKEYCQGCNWTCPMMSKATFDDPKIIDDLHHSEKRQ